MDSVMYSIPGCLRDVDFNTFLVRLWTYAMDLCHVVIVRVRSCKLSDNKNPLKVRNFEHIYQGMRLILIFVLF